MIVTALLNGNGRWRQVMRLNHKIEVSATVDVLLDSPALSLMAQISGTWRGMTLA
ncbi:hypothetical protein QUA20_31655 [Microcoleus sp. Pol7_A1]|uniref:hypothetical protein n=1 Tax=Microcoleus sp. Pol7_A1 TaxID=2818893 RepID=UPI002FD630E0